METINFTRGVPANESFPTAELIDAASAVFRSHGNQMLQYGPSRGFEPLRQWLAEWQHVDVDRIITSNGSLQLIEFLCLHLLGVGPGVSKRCLRMSMELNGVSTPSDSEDGDLFVIDRDRRTGRSAVDCPGWRALKLLRLRITRKAAGVPWLGLGRCVDS
jgi:hypothetical protein